MTILKKKMFDTCDNCNVLWLYLKIASYVKVVHFHVQKYEIAFFYNSWK